MSQKVKYGRKALLPTPTSAGFVPLSKTAPLEQNVDPIRPTCLRRVMYDGINEEWVPYKLNQHVMLGIGAQTQEIGKYEHWLPVQPGKEGTSQVVKPIGRGRGRGRGTGGFT